MELFLIFLIALSGKNGEELKRSLSSALAFYRENRELFTMIAQTPAQKENAPSEPEEQTKSRPQAAGNYKFIEEFLSKKF